MLQSTEQRNGVLAAQLADKEEQMLALSQQHKDSSEQAGSLLAQVCDLKLALARSKAKYETQQSLVSEFHTLLEKRELPEG